MILRSMDIHNYKKKFERTLERIKEDTNLSNEDKLIIHKFKDNCLCRGLSYGKIDAYLFYLTKFIKMLNKPVEGATKNDIERVMGELHQTNYAEETKVCFKIVVRKLYQMLRGFEEKEYPGEDIIEVLYDLKKLSNSISRHKDLRPVSKKLKKYGETLLDPDFNRLALEILKRIVLMLNKLDIIFTKEGKLSF